MRALRERSLNERALAVTLVFAVVLDGILAVLFWWCVPVVIASSQEKSALLADIARDYNASAPRVAGRCVHITVNRKASGEAEEALATDWDPRVDGEPPVVWSPAATSWTVLLRQHRSSRGVPDLLPATTPSIMQSPLVIAMPKPMAAALGWPDKAVGWSDVLTLARDPGGWSRVGHPEWGAFRLGKTNPTFSTSGLHALVGSYFAATGRPPVEADMTSPAVVEFVRDVESSVVHYGDSVSTFLVNLLDADRRGEELKYVSAIATEEKQVVDYNDGNPLSLATPTELPPKTQLVAFYPKEGTLVADHPYAILGASWVDAAQREAAEAFRGYLLSEPVQLRFANAAFRSHDGAPGPRIKESNGVLPGWSGLVLRPPVGPLLERMQRSWNDLRKRARILIAIDVSAPMREPLAGGGTKLGLAKQAAAAALATDQLAPDDDVGVWTFTGGASSAAPYRELAPVGPLASRREAIKALIGDLDAEAGDTPLYATTRAAIRHIAERFDRKRIDAVILMTSGRNKDRDDDLIDLLRALRSQPEDTWVRVFGVTYGTTADASTVQQIAKASRAAAYEALDSATIRRVIAAVLSNF
jgi:Ca-activated chloride channel homolog